MQPARRLANLQPSIIAEMTLLAERHGAINLSQGSPDFPAPKAVKQAAVEAIWADQNQYGMTPGQPAIRRAIAEKLRRLYGMDWVDPDAHVTVMCGATEAVVVAVMATANPGDEVIVIEPCHENYLPAVTFAGARPVCVPLEPPDYVLDPDRLQRAFSPRTRAIIVNTPHNPTGRVFTRQELTAIAELCQTFDVVAVTDEIYEHFVYDAHVHIPLATLPGMAGRTITISGLSKTYAITGWRLAYAVAQEPWSTALRTVHEFTTICAPTPLQEGAAVAFSLPDTYYAELKATHTERRNCIYRILNEVGFKAMLPEGTYYIMADFGRFSFEGDDIAFARWMASRARVAVVPGSSFYHTPGLGRSAVRFAFPKRLETLEEAGVRMQTALAALGADN